MFDQLLEPTNMFCCGCSLSVGVPIIQCFHLMTCILYVAVAYGSVVLHMQSYSSTWGPTMQMALAALYLCGIPIILAGLWGVAKRALVNLQFYLGYLSLCLLIDSIFLIHAFIWEDPCKTTGSFLKMMGEDFGPAFVCGFARVGSWLFIFAALSVEVYCAYIVWSLCEEIRMGTSWLWELIPSAEEAWKKKHSRDNGPVETAYNDIVGLPHTKVQGPYPSPYGATEAFAAPNYNILGGTNHVTDYPTGWRPEHEKNVEL